MNKETIKAINKKPTVWGALCRWWSKNGYLVLRVLLFPVWAIVWTHEKLEAHRDKQMKWSEERAAEILSYYIPRRAEWDAEKKQFWFYDNGMGWTMKCTCKKYIKLRDRRFWKKYACGWGYKMREYLVNNFELDGFTKEVTNIYYGETEIIFKLRED